MRNPWFKFKCFSLRQDKAAMKICTDACLFGAWTAARLGDARHILDIGTGTGLLTLMLAQKKETDEQARLEAIEMDEPSRQQAAENFAISTWAENIKIHAGDVSTYIFPASFDFVIVNPPFYEGQLRSPDEAANNARHESGLTLETLTAVLQHIISPDGRFAILLPADREEYFCRLASVAGYALLDRLRLKQTPNHEPFRSMMLFASGSVVSAGYRSGTTEMIIRDKEGRETAELLELMKEFYLR